MTWITDTYVPLDYRGAALPSRGSNVEVAAQFNSKGLNPEELTFNWFLNNHIQDESGLGKQNFKFQMSESITKDHIIRVEVIDRNNYKIATSKNLFLKARLPEIVIKLKSPALGFLEQYNLSGDQEVEFTAQPFFFNIFNLSELEYQWQFGQKIAPQVDVVDFNDLSIKIGKVNETIRQTLEVWVENRNNRIQRNSASAEVFLVP